MQTASSKTISSCGCDSASRQLPVMLRRKGRALCRESVHAVVENSFAPKDTCCSCRPVPGERVRCSKRFAQRACLAQHKSTCPAGADCRLWRGGFPLCERMHVIRELPAGPGVDGVHDAVNSLANPNYSRSMSQTRKPAQMHGLLSLE